MDCRICGNTERNRTHKAREMMLGTRDPFVYNECGRCGTLQISEVPDLAPYYPRDYYSLSEDRDDYFALKLRRRIAARFVGDYFVNGRNPVGRYLAQKDLGFVSFFPASLRDPILKIGFRSRLLDFGCGRGKLLRYLYHYGFRDLTGVDAFIDGDIVYDNGIRIFKRDLSEVDPAFDLIMLHHSFEHLPDPRPTLRQIRRLLPDEGWCLIRMPVVAYAWERYGVNWFQLDPPRHLFLYTERAFRDLAADEGFEVSKVVYDSEVYQFYISEQYAQDISMHDKRAFDGDFAKSIFTPDQMREWERQADALNRENRGDQACFYLRKADPDRA